MEIAPAVMVKAGHEATVDFLDAVPRADRELASRVWADLSTQIAFDPVSHKPRPWYPPYVWDIILADTRNRFNAWTQYNALPGSSVSILGSMILDACGDFVASSR